MNNSYKMRVDGRRWPVRGESLLTVATCIIVIVSLLKAWKVTLVRTKCDDAVFQRHYFRKVHKRLLTVHNYCESCKSLEYDSGKDRVR